MNEISPNATTEGAVTDQIAVPSLESIADKMTAMRQGTERNQMILRKALKKQRPRKK